MSENESRFIIAFDGKGGDLAQVLSSLKASVRSTVSDLQATTAKIELFKGLDASSKALSQAFFAAQERAAGLRQEIARIQGAGGDVGKELVRALKDVERAALAAGKQYNAQAGQLDTLRSQLAKAGVDTGRLATEELRLADALKAANKAAVEQSSKDLLGFKSLKDIQPQINQLNAAYRALMDSGKLSFGETSGAAARLQQRVAELKAETNGAGAAFGQMKTQLLAIGASITGVIASIAKAAENYRAFAQQVAAVDSIADVSKAKLGELASGVRELARRLGVDAVESTKALYEIISSGIPADNALTVLEQATKAATAGMTDVATAARVGVSVLNAYGLEVNQLGRVYDILFQTVKDGVVTFPQLAASLGEMLPTARSAKIPLEELGAALVVLTRNGISAPEATTALTRAIQDLAAPAPEAATRMRELGLEVKGLSGTIEELAKRNLTLAQLRDIIPDVRAIKAIQVLAQNYRLLRDEIGEMNKEAAAAEAAYAKMANTPQKRVDQFNAAIKDLSLSVGEFVTGATGFINTLADIVNSFNALPGSTRRAAIEFTAFAAIIGALYFTLNKLAVPLNLLGAALLANVPAIKAFGTEISVATGLIGLFKVALAGLAGFELGKSLYANVEPVRLFGDALGIMAGRVTNVAELLAGKLAAAFTGNRAASDAASAAFRRNVAVLNEMERALGSGVTERLRALDQQFQTLQGRLERASAAATKVAGDLSSTVGAIAANVGAQLTGVDRAILQLEQRLQALTASLAASVQATQSAAGQALANLKAEADARIAALDQSRQMEVKTAADTIAIQQTASAQRLEILKQYAVNAKTAFEAEAQARLDIARRTSGNVAQVEQDLAVARRGMLQQVVDAWRGHVNDLVALEQGHLGKIREIEEQRRGINASVEEKIREARRSTMDAYQQYADRQREVDELLSKARRALVAGDLKTAEDYANRAISLTSSIAKEVKDGNQVVVDAYTAQRTSVSLYEQAQSVLNKALDRRKELETEGAKAAGEGLRSARGELESLTAELTKAQGEAQKGIAIKITQDQASVAATLAALDTEFAQREFLLKVNADVQRARLEIDRLKSELEAGITVNVDARTDKITTALNEIRDNAPELDLDVGKALKSIATLKEKAAEITNVRMEIQSNAKAVQTEIDKLKLPTESVHTIRVRRVEEKGAGGPVGVSGYRRGGPVFRPLWWRTAPEGAQGFAGGGTVFRRPSWSRVPGAGDGDTVPASLQAGSFVVRKAAARYYGDDLMGRLARGFAVGGPVGRLLLSSPLLTRLLSRDASGFKATSGLDALGDGGSAADEYRDTLQKLQALREAAMGLKRPSAGMGMADWAGWLIQYWQLMSERKRQQIKAVIAESYDGWIAGAETARQWGVPMTMEIALAALASLNYARGGAGPGIGTDTVPAMLTPGEWVIRRPAVAKYGAGLLDSINSMRLPRLALQTLFAPPQVPRFAYGGPVGAASPARQRSAPAAAGGISVNINASAGDLLSADNVRRFIVPVINDMMRRSG